MNTTKSEATQALALQVTVFATKHQQAVTKLAVQEHISECATGHRGEYLQHCALLVSYKAVHKLAVEQLKQQGDYHLIGA